MERMEKTFKFTPKNLLDNIDRLGPWSCFALAEHAILHYFPRMKKIKGTAEQICKMAELSTKYEMCWQDWIILYQLDIGYDAPNGFNSDYVNEH